MSAHRLHEPTANERLHASYVRWLGRAAAAAVAIHAIVLLFVVTPAGAPIREANGESTVVIELRYKLPPPPEEPVRPAEPRVAETPTSEEITIEPSVLTDAEPVDVGPPPFERWPDQTEDPSFVVYTVRPRCVERCAPADVLAHVPAILRKAGVSCRVVVGLRIDLEGRVTETRILQSSGAPECDDAVERWARTTTWTTAYNRDVPVAVWIAQPVEVSTE